MDSNAAAKNQIRVLVVEIHPQRREQLIYNLKQRFEVFVAEGSGEALWHDAQEKVNVHRCHVAVVGLRLQNASNPNDRSGLELANTLAPAGAVIYAPVRDTQLANEVGWRKQGFVCHDDSREVLLNVVQKLAEMRPSQRLNMAWSPDEFITLVTNSLKMQPDEVTLEHIDRLLLDLFPEAMTLSLKPLPAMGTDALIASPVRRSVVILVEERRSYTKTYLAPKVVKIGLKERIVREVENYHRFVDGFLSGHHQARLEKDSARWHLGAVVYTFFGASAPESPDEMHTFRQFYASHSPDRVLDVLLNVFAMTYSRWRKEDRAVENATLFELYDQALNLTKHLGRLSNRDTPTLSFDDFAAPLPNPAHWVESEGRAVTFNPLMTCITHGDLHADNFFIDQSGQAWLIDFEQTGHAHILRDFVELEADIKLRLTAPGSNGLAGQAALERSLLTGRTPGTLLAPAQEVVADPALLKAFQVIAGLRHLAHLTTGVSDLREYYLALLYETIFMATLERLSPAVRQRALFSAALIVERLLRRTGLLGVPPMIPQLDPDALRHQPRDQAVALAKAHWNHLDACGQAAMLQRRLYRQPPAELEAGLAQLKQEVAQTQRTLKALGTSGRTP